MKIQSIIENHWYQKLNRPLACLFYPLSLVFVFVVKLRYYLYQFKLLPSHKIKVPVVIVGNLTVGGVGKTPITKKLALDLTKLGIKVGVVLRGHGGTNVNPLEVHTNSLSELVGDEALIYAKASLNTVVGINRVNACNYILEQHPDTQIIICDDGLQHYRLKHDYEIVVMDSSREFTNYNLLPMGSFREPLSRLQQINSLIINGSVNGSDSASAKMFSKYCPNLIIHTKMQITRIFNPVLQINVPSSYFDNLNTILMAAIGNPLRFFNSCHSYGISFDQTLDFPDHHQFKLEEIPTNFDAIIVTEKDYVKLESFNNDKIWVVEIEPEFKDTQLIEQIRNLVQNN